MPARLVALGRVQPLAQLLAGLEEGDVFVLDEDRVPGAGIASLPRGPVLYREGTEPAQLYPVATRERTRDLIEYDVDDALHVAMEEMRIGGRHFLNQLGLDHETPHPGAVLRRYRPPASWKQGAKPKQDRQA